MDRLEREAIVAERWKKYYEVHKNKCVTNVFCTEKKKEADGFYPYILFVYVEPHHYYNFMVYVNADEFSNIE